MTDFDRVSIGRRTTPEGEMVVFIEGTEVLTEIPTEVFREAAKFVTKFASETSGASIAFFKDSTYRLHVGNWGTKVVVSLYRFGGLAPLGTWDMSEVDPF